MSARTKAAAGIAAAATALALGAAPALAGGGHGHGGGGGSAVARPAPATDPSGPWRSDDHRPRRGGWRDYVLAPATRALAPESVLQAAPRGGAIDGDPGAALRADGRAVTLTSIGDRTASPLLALDFGQEIGGHVRVKLSGASATPPRLHACFSESKRYRALGSRNDGQARFAPGCDTANIWVGFPGTAYSYDADSHTLDLPATVPGEAYDRTLRGGFRYLTLFLDGPGSVDVDAVTVDYAPEPSRRDPSRLAGWFNSSDEELNKIWHAGVYTVQVNTDRADTAKSWPYGEGERDHADGQLSGLDPDDEVIYDGGKRDRLVWQGDLAVQNPVSYVSTWNLPAVDNSLVHLAQQQLEDGFVPASSQMGPHNAGERRNYGEYVTWFVFNMAEHYRYTGDRAFLTRWWPAIRRAAAWLESVRAQDPRGLIGFAEVRSCGHYGYSDCGHETYVNALYKRNLDQLATLAGALGDTAAARTYAARAGEVARAIEAQLWDEQAGAYRLSRELPAVHPQDGNAAAVLTGVAQGDRATRALAFLRASTWARYGSLTVSPEEQNPSLSPFYAPLPSGFEAEARFGLAGDPRGLEAEDGVALLKRFWGHQLRQDPGSTFVEHLQPSGYPNLSQFSSLAHGWASGPTVVLSRRVLGVDPTEAGYARFDVAPQPAGLEWAEGAVPTPHGQIRTGWRRDGDDLKLELTVPRGTTGRASVPTFGRTVRVRLDGRLVWDGRRARAAGVSRAGDRILVDGLARGGHVVRSEAIGDGVRDELRLQVSPARATVEPGDLVAVSVALRGVARRDLEGSIEIASSDPDWEVSPKRAAFELDSDGRPVSETLKAYVVVPDDATSGRRTITVTARTRGGAQASGTTTLSLTATRVLFGFEQDAEGWQAGENVSGVARVASFANGPGKPSEGAGALEATARSVAANALKSVVVTPARALDLSDASELSVMVDAYGGAPGATGYEAVLTVTGAGGETRSVTTAVNADAWNRVALDLAGWAGRSAISRIEVGFRATGSDTLWQPRFQLDAVGVTSG
jgi:hypothetical protein